MADAASSAGTLPDGPGPLLAKVRGVGLASAVALPAAAHGEARAEPADEPVDAAADEAADEAGPAGGSQAADVIRLCNARRARAGQRPLQSKARLRHAAEAHARHLAETGTFSHDGWVGFIRRAGYRNDTGELGENIASGQDGAAEVVGDWLASPGHRQNILNARFTDIGVAHVGGVWVQMFGGR